MTLAENANSSPEWRILLACACPRPDVEVLRKRLGAPVDWERLLHLAEAHGLIPLLADRVCGMCPDRMPSKFAAILREQRRGHVLFALSMTAELFRLMDRFRAAEMDSVVVKGPALAVQAFGDPALRQYSDLDILMRHRDVLRAARVLHEAGFEAKTPLGAAAAGRVPGQFLFSHRATRTIVELHTERTLRYFPRRLPLDDFFSRRVRLPLDGREVLALSAEDTLSFICLHGSKHLWERLMWIADVAALVTRSVQLDWSRAVTTAKETGTERVVHLGLRLAMEALGLQVPREMERAVRADRVAGRLAEAILGRLPAGESYLPSVPERALFRVHMCDSFLRGAVYLLRLSFAPTEEDWTGAGAGSGWIEALRRPLRLAHKYGRGAAKAAGRGE